MQTINSPKLRDQLGNWYHQLHAENKFSGESWRVHTSQLLSLVGRTQQSIAGSPHGFTALDFGCGPRGGLQGLWGKSVRAYDPYVPQYTESPWGKGPYDLIFTADVLEHLDLADIRKFSMRVRGETPRYLYLAIATRPASKLFPNGTNVHLTIETADWWRGFFQAQFPELDLVIANADLHDGVVSLGFRRPVATPP